MSNVSYTETYFRHYHPFQSLQNSLKEKKKQKNNFAGRLKITPREEFHLRKDKKNVLGD